MSPMSAAVLLFSGCRPKPKTYDRDEIIRRYVEAKEKKELQESEETCPVCGSKLYFAEGCYTCLSCGYSKCG